MKNIGFQNDKNHELCESLYVYLKKFDVNESTISSYRNVLTRFFAWYVKPIYDLSQEDLTAYKNALLQKKYSPSTVNHHVTVIGRLVNYLKKKGVVFDEELRFQKIPIQNKEFMDYVLTEEQVENMIQAARDIKDLEAVAIITTLAYSGVRAHELLLIPTTAVKCDAVKIIGKRKKERTLFLTPGVRKSWRNYLKTVDEKGEYIFQISRTSIHRIVKHYAELAHIPPERVHAHAFRHFCGKYLHKKGYSLTKIMAILGHKDPKTAVIYTKPTREEIEQDMQRDFKRERRGRRKKVVKQGTMRKIRRRKRN